MHQTADKLLGHFYDGPAASIAELQSRLDGVRAPGSRTAPSPSART
jgi:hypothetical protein